jgi:hypothetical protein
METVFLVRYVVFCVTSVNGIAGKKRIFTEIFLAPQTKFTMAAGVAHPWNADPISQFKNVGPFTRLYNGSNNFVAWNERKLGIR